MIMQVSLSLHVQQAGKGSQGGRRRRKKKAGKAKKEDQRNSFVMYYDQDSFSLRDTEIEPVTN